MARTPGSSRSPAAAFGRRAGTRASRRPRRAAGPGRLLLRIAGWAAAAGVVVVVAMQLWYLAHIVWWKHNDPASTRFMREQHAALRLQNPIARIAHLWVPYERISPHLKRAVIAAEDANFTEHDGVDWDAIEKARERNLQRGRVTHGGSTITMQLAKNLFLSGERSYLRKGQELVIAYMLEAVLGKRRILEIYLNVAEWGVGVFGCEAGARHHFGVGAARLDREQAALMAAMLPRPRHYDRNPGASALHRRAQLIERWMDAVDAP
jgi:monofunctional glycosyltransferase